ncbi:protein of unknown function DUF1501 [Pseudopedobacter saltans DSM 12145]|uniref:Twin-arginine translocation pathway signal n=1 Tax=Pseudopedobacter saltans (strain ATCC 51119 / DSM 12145 / JCM 21818 / CCUG 39354 / LMG 10337 / NBRC 100064 / NCIMB 13643) TaxID=762903 RepID=F0SA21_PSESL|nr:DUF1501 domain-containing protein [Pseudopedobacter saltans]ADY53585.1 protein of unknown function DUF1501 [Pseudopedobacter saltans DSM 12145]
MKRRDFLKQSGLATGAFLIPSFLKPLEAMASGNFAGHKNLVIVQLSGGNDGLNTVVPFGMDEYYQGRKTIAIEANKVIKLNDLQGLNPNMQALRELYDQGEMSIINSVGYPNPDRSHFRSMDIWQTASDSNQYLSTGWIGRYLDSNCKECSFPYAAIEVDDTLSLAMKGGTLKGIAVKDPQQLYRNTREPFFKEVVNEGKEMLDEDNLGYLYKTMIETSSSAKYILDTTKTYNSLSSYPNNAFGNQLKTIAKFINSGLTTRVYYVSLSGFDTHTNQVNQQGRLLQQYSEAINAFSNDLKKAGTFKDTLVMTFSEFGRRVQQNASDGTDHGTANNIFLFGGNLKEKGIINGAPNLKDLDSGDLKYEVDFRQVYATVLDKWLAVDDSKILNRKFSSLNFV